jgi:Ser/Thr protein kinase RdoA (MazF antagonist)
MKPFAELTHLGKVRRLRALAKEALRAYDLGDAEFHLIQRGENTTFRVKAPPRQTVSSQQTSPDALYRPGYFLLRIHRPGYQDEGAVASELTWLAALRAAGLAVPEPVPNGEGALYTVARAPGVPGPQRCSLLRWMNGRFHEANPKPRHIAAVGRTMARLHAHVETWRPPPGFSRRSWDSEGLFGDNGGFDLPKERLWALIPTQYAEGFRAVADQATRALADLDREPGARGLLHADLHLGNVLFARENAGDQLQARPIDFDDCGYAHWVYDFAVVLGDYITEDTYDAFHEALLSGYAEVRRLPQRQLAYLELFIAGRLVSLMLWATDMAQSNPGFAERLESWYTWAATGIERCRVL